MSIKIEDLLQSKGILDEKAAEKTDSITIKSLKEKGIGDGTITIKSIAMDKVQDIIDEGQGKMHTMNLLTVYNGVTEPNLKDKSLQEGFGCKTNPHGIVEKIFDPSEIKVIADKISALSGIGKTENEVIEAIKNS